MLFVFVSVMFKADCEPSGNLFDNIITDQFTSSNTSAFSIAVTSSFIATVTSSSAGTGQWLQVDLLQRMIVRSSTTSSHANTWIDAYHISYTDVTTSWMYILDNSGLATVFIGNSNTVSGSNEQVFTSIVIARFVRIHPISYFQTLQFAWQLKGCSFGKC